MQEVRAIGDDAIHVCVDMQDLFALDTAWHTPSIPEILPNIERLVRHRPERTVFTRFTTPKSAGQATGHWQAYYRRWRSVTTAVMDPSMLDLVTELRPFAPPARIVDKPTYSAFGSRAFRDLLRGEGRATLICSGRRDRRLRPGDRDVRHGSRLPGNRRRRRLSQFGRRVPTKPPWSWSTGASRTRSRSVPPTRSSPAGRDQRRQ